MIGLSFDIRSLYKGASRLIIRIILLLSYFFLGITIGYYIDLGKQLDALSFLLSENIPHYDIFYELFQLTLITTIGYTLCTSFFYGLKYVSYAIFKSIKGSYLGVYHVGKTGEEPYLLIDVKDLKYLFLPTNIQQAIINLQIGILLLLMKIYLLPRFKIDYIVITYIFVFILLIIWNSYFAFQNRAREYAKTLFLDMNLKSQLVKMYLGNAYRRLLRIEFIKDMKNEVSMSIRDEAIKSLKRILRELSLLRLLEGRIDIETYILILNEIESLSGNIKTLTQSDYIQIQNNEN